MFRRMSRKCQQQCTDAMQVMRIEDLANKRIGQLSGGQQQRVFLARALINHPDLLILDEPTVGIDAESQASFFELITHMHEHHRMTFLMVSHDMDRMESYLGSKAAVTNGKIHFHVRHSHEVEDCAETNLQHTTTQRALAGGLLIGITAPLIGLFLVLRRLSMIGDTLSHVTIAGVALGFLIEVYPIA
ncbi:hypothetical protein G195_001304, partial [Phytophthora kernoviae 00238/432]